MRGASAIERALGRHPNAAVRVFAIWEPMLPTDWGKPGRFTLSRLSDPRVTQFWDGDRVFAKRLAADRRDPQPKPTCCEQDGVPWDLGAVYPKGAVWNARLPPAALLDGPVVDSAPAIEATLNALPPGG